MTDTRWCRSCGQAKALGADHFRPLPHRPLGVQLYARRCRGCEVAMQTGTLPTAKERRLAWRMTQADATPEPPNDLAALRQRAAKRRVQTAKDGLTRAAGD